MPRTRSLGWAELKIGLLTIFALAMAAILIFLLSSTGGLWWQRYPLKTLFDNVAGLGEGAPVRVAGVEVGSVTGVQFIGDRVEVSFEVNEDVQPRITTASRASLGSVSLLGESAVDITPASQGTPIAEWGYVPSVPATGSIAEVATQATKSLEEATRLISDIRAGRGTVGKLFTDDALYKEVNAFVSRGRAGRAQRWSGARHARQAHQRSGRGEGARGLAAEPGGRDGADPVGGGKSRPAGRR